jgi:uncharacterized protein (TIGR02246 family)
MVLMLCLAVSGVQADSRKSIEKGIQKTDAELLAALKAGDPVRMAECYTKDVILFAAMNPPVHGRDGVARHMEYVMDLGIRSYDLDIDELIPGDDTAIQIGKCVLLNAAREEVVRVRFMTIWKKEDGRWKIHRDMTTY